MVVRDRRGKMPLDVAKNEQVRALLRQSATSEGHSLKNSGSLASISTANIGTGLGQQQSSQNTPPSMRG